MNPYTAPATSECGDSSPTVLQQVRLVRPAWRDRVFGPLNRRLFTMVSILFMAGMGFSCYSSYSYTHRGRALTLTPTYTSLGCTLLYVLVSVNLRRNAKILRRASSLFLQEIPLAAGRVFHLSVDGRRVRGILGLSRTEIRFLPGGDEDATFSLAVSEINTVFSDPDGKKLTLFFKDDRQETFATNSPQEWQAELEKLAVSSTAQPSA